MPLPVILTKKIGPMPGWAWGGLGIGVALAVASWQKSKADSPAGDEAITQSYDLPENMAPTYVFQNYDQDRTYIDVTTPVTVPPGGGRPTTPPPPPTRTPPTTKPGPFPPPVVKPPPTRTPPPPVVKPPPAPRGQWVTVVPWKTGRKPGTPDSIWGIAEKIFGTSKVTRALTAQIWEAPQNATLRGKRGKDPAKIQPGDKVWVPQ